jgi:hypothetical protein
MNIFERLKYLRTPTKSFWLDVRIDVVNSVFVTNVMRIDEVARRFCVDLDARGIKASVSQPEVICVYNFKPSQETLMHLLITEYGEYYLETKEA